jgi:hypothetical protein
MAGDEELKNLRDQAKEDRILIRKAADALAEIDRNEGLSDEHADVLTALRIRVEGKKHLGDVLSGADDKDSGGWPVIEEKKREWPGG